MKPTVLSSLLMLILSSWGTSSAIARSTEVVSTHTRSSQEFQSRSTGDDEYQAQAWGLKQDEWARYRQLMQGPLGVYSPNIDPLTALGIEARNDDELRHYAQLQVQAEAIRVEKLLVYQRAYDEAWKRLYPDLQRVNLNDNSPALSSPLMPTGSGRLAVFVKENCNDCEHLISRLTVAKAEFDLYMVGNSQDDVTIREWARRVKIAPSKVKAGQITLNHDAGRWLSLNLPGELPAVVRWVDGQWQRQ
ncbi:TIGR03759 family integrating conjugative element protein [Pseudomonas sp. TNT2022 ID357]|uniref:TIGR03759 family integrating conjugative element protein n=1 Tax=Pseudomonas idahonensis TaxID=2942628 RepID=A0ABT5Q3P2_9PSED|nr:TIGR03759 family integrating conjugative element protein [Pseudomonas idahonensis]MDD1148811.1 TIGR03759 family integrating conjugative element protein [Pseudomonas idahonensis]